MKIDKLTKILLAVIAINLTIMTVDNLELVPRAYADTSDDLNPNYGLVPINEDGSINVKFIDVVDVEIVGIATHDNLDVNVEGWNTRDLNVNVNEWSAGELDVNVIDWDVDEITVWVSNME